MSFIMEQSPLVQALLLTVGTWAIAAIGSASVFLTKEISMRTLDLLMGFGAGIMIASSFWSLMLPALEGATGVEALVPITGFTAGGMFVVILDKFFDTFGFEQRFGEQSKGIKRSALLVLAVTLHNIPEGMAVGMAVAGAGLGLKGATTSAAILLAVGIGLQNFTEGASVALPLRREGLPLKKCFIFGQLSGLPEPFAAVLGVFMAYTLSGFLPFMLMFAAGAMIAVVCGELIPAFAVNSKNTGVSGVLCGFVFIMMVDAFLK